MKALAFAARQPLPPVRTVRIAPAPAGDSAVDWLLRSIAAVPLAILGVELIVDAVLVFIGAIFAATIFLLFVSLALFFVAIWLTVGLSTIGAIVASLATLAALIVVWQQRRQHHISRGALAGLLLSLSGVALHALVIAAAVYCHVALLG